MLGLEITTVTGEPWLSATLEATRVSPGEPVEVSVTADPSKLTTQQSDTGTVRVTSNGQAVRAISVTLVSPRTGGGELELSRTALWFEILRGAAGGLTQEFAILSRGDAELRWRTEGRGVSFLNFGLGAESGATPSAAFTQIAVDVFPPSVVRMRAR